MIVNPAYSCYVLVIMLMYWMLDNSEKVNIDKMEMRVRCWSCDKVTKTSVGAEGLGKKL